METIRQEQDSMKKKRRGLGLQLYPERKRGRGVESSCTSHTQPLLDSWPMIIIMIIMIIIAAITCFCI